MAPLSTTLLRPERAHAAGRRATWVTVLGLVLVPLTVAGLLTWALWQPTERLDRVQAAVVNLDRPVEVDGQTVPLGRQLAAALVTSTGPDAGADAEADPDGTDDTARPVADVSGSDSTENFTWTLTDDDDAAAGLADGTYTTVVTIPPTFSAAVTSVGGDPADATRATLDIATSVKSRLVDDAVARAVTGAAIGLLNEQLTSAYLTTVYVGFTTLGDSLGQAVAGAGELATGAGGIGSGATELATGSRALADGVGQLGGGADELADGVDQVADGADELASGLDRLATETAASARTAADAAPQARAFTDGLDALATGVAGDGGLAAGTTGLARGAAGLQTGVAALLDTLEAQATACAGGDRTACATVVGLVRAQQEATAGGQPTVTAAAAGVAQGAAGLDAAVNDGVDGQPSLAAATTQLAAGGRSLAEGVTASASGLGTLSGFLRQSADGAEALAAGADAATDGATRLATGARDAADGASQLSAGAGELAAGAEQLGAGAGELAGGLAQAGEEVPTYTDEEAERLADVAATPVAADDADGALVGARSVPFLVTVGLWLGGLATFLLLGAVTRRALGSTRSSLALALGSFAPAALVGLVQGLAVTALMGFAVDLSPGGWLAFAGVAVLAGLAFAAVNQGLVAVLGGVGRFVAVVVAVVGLGSTVVSTVPAVFDDVVGATPLAPALAGLQGVVDGSGGTGGAVVALVLWTLTGLALTTLAVARRRVVPAARLVGAPRPA